LTPAARAPTLRAFAGSLPLRTRDRSADLSALARDPDRAKQEDAPMGFVRLMMIAMVAAVAFGSAGCAKKQVTRLETDTVTDLSGVWNDTDSRLTAEQMITSATTKPWVTSFIRENSENPVVIAGSIKNRSSEHINTRTFLKDIQRAFINGGMVNVVADSGERDEVRDERLDQLENASPETVKQLGMELGADYMLSGEINTLFDQEDGKQVKFYQVDLQLIDIQSNRIVWLETNKIKKGITKGKYKV
jgi:hypothetical protein